MTLDAIVETNVDKPYRVVVYGERGVGKTSFGLTAPKPILIPVEDGPGELRVKAFPRPDTWAEIIQCVHTLTNDIHPHQSVVLDTLDRAEPMNWRMVCEGASKKSIKDFKYGDGYSAAMENWNELLFLLEQLQKKRGMNVILIAHAQLKKFTNPAGPDFDMWSLKLNEKASGVIQDWAEDVLFAGFELFTDMVDERAKGITTGKRILYTTKQAAFSAKNRHALPLEIELPAHRPFEAFASAVQHNRRAADHMREILADKPDRLAKLEDWLTETRLPNELVEARDALLQEFGSDNDSNDSNDKKEESK
jgi:hypothetical protein